MKDFPIAGPNNWENFFPLCGNTEQSPIDINTESAKEDPKLQEFRLKKFDNKGLTFKLLNNGRTGKNYGGNTKAI